MRPEKVNLTCRHCGHQWLQPTAAFVAARVIVYRGDKEIVKRRLACPNCDKGVVVEVPKAWLEYD